MKRWIKFVLACVLLVWLIVILKECSGIRMDGAVVGAPIENVISQNRMEWR